MVEGDYMEFTANDAKKMMLHKDDIMFEVRERCYTVIRAAALDGQAGTIFKYPMNYIGCAEFNAFVNELIDNGFIVLEQNGIYDGYVYMEIYWC